MDALDEQIFTMDRYELDAYPHGIITLDRSGKILQYNRTEAELARRVAGDTIGLDFFTDVAPCTAVREFKGRFETFAATHDSAVERFDFVFRFAWGAQNVGITMIRRAGFQDIALLIARRSVDE